MDAHATEGFFSQLPAFNHFDGVTEPSNYRPLPDDWWLATADVMSSTKAIETYREKANTGSGDLKASSPTGSGGN